MSLAAMLITRMLNGPRPADSSLRATWMTKEFPITATKSMERQRINCTSLRPKEEHYIVLFRCWDLIRSYL